MLVHRVENPVLARVVGGDRTAARLDDSTSMAHGRQRRQRAGPISGAHRAQDRRPEEYGLGIGGSTTRARVSIAAPCSFIAATMCRVPRSTSGKRHVFVQDQRAQLLASSE